MFAYAGANTQVTIEAQGVGTFIGNSTITWSQNGNVVLKGQGQRDLTFTTGASAPKQQIHADDKLLNAGYAHQ